MKSNNHLDKRRRIEKAIALWGGKCYFDIPGKVRVFRGGEYNDTVSFRHFFAWFNTDRSTRPYAKDLKGDVSRARRKEKQLLEQGKDELMSDPKHAANPWDWD